MIIAYDSHGAGTTNYIWDNELALLLNSLSQSPTWRDPRKALHAWGPSNSRHPIRSNISDNSIFNLRPLCALHSCNIEAHLREAGIISTQMQPALAGNRANQVVCLLPDVTDDSGFHLQELSDLGPSMQWILSRLAAMRGAAENDDFYHDDDISISSPRDSDPCSLNSGLCFHLGQLD